MFLIKVSHVIVKWPHLSFGLLVSHLACTISDFLTLLQETVSHSIMMNDSHQTSQAFLSWIRVTCTVAAKLISIHSLRGEKCYQSVWKKKRSIKQKFKHLLSAYPCVRRNKGLDIFSSIRLRRLKQKTS